MDAHASTIAAAADSPLALIDERERNFNLAQLKPVVAQRSRSDPMDMSPTYASLSSKKRNFSELGGDEGSVAAKVARAAGQSYAQASRVEHDPPSLGEPFLNPNEFDHLPSSPLYSESIADEHPDPDPLSLSIGSQESGASGSQHSQSHQAEHPDPPSLGEPLSVGSQASSSQHSQPHQAEHPDPPSLGEPLSAESQASGSQHSQPPQAEPPDPPSLPLSVNSQEASESQSSQRENAGSDLNEINISPLSEAPQGSPHGQSSLGAGFRDHSPLDIPDYMEALLVELARAINS